MARAVSPSGGGEAAAWVIPGVAAAALVVGGSLWIAGGLASTFAGLGWQSAPFGLSTLIGVVTSGTEPYWPGADPRLVFGGAALLAALLLLPPGRWALRRYVNAPAADDPRRSLARPVHLAPMLRRAAAARALRLRPSLVGTKPQDLPPGDVGLLLGRLGPKPRSPELFCSWEDVAVAIMAPRSGKTTTLAVPITLAAPGAVVLTSNKSEGWKETAQLRAEQTGEAVWTFDPQRVAHAPQTWWWNPMRDLTTVAEASRLAGHFVATVEDDRRDIWGPAAKELLATLLLAAAVGGRSLVDVYEWLANEATPVPGGLLREHGYDLLARTLRGTQDSPPETRGSVYFTARAATACLRDPQITAWVTPPANGANNCNGGVGADRPDGAAGSLVEFRPEDFPTSRQTLYLLSKDEGGSAGPLVAALTDRVLRCGVAAAERRGGRLDPPMVLVLDEAANICRISDLPALYSHLGSRGIVPLTILQSYSQAVGVWGETGTKALWGAATVKLIGAGMDDPSFAEDLSRLVGDHDVLTVSHNSGGGRGGSSRTSATRQQRILPANAIRELPRGRALLLATGSKPAMLTLQPWYTGPRAAEISAAETTAMANITARASAGDAQPDTTEPDTAQPIPPQPAGPYSGSDTEALA
jgi:type IV secretory pathway TraG/TraD family ATPase VirD4